MKKLTNVSKNSIFAKSNRQTLLDTIERLLREKDELKQQLAQSKAVLNNSLNRTTELWNQSENRGTELFNEIQLIKQTFSNIEKY